MDRRASMSNVVTCACGGKRALEMTIRYSKILPCSIMILVLALAMT